MEQRCFEQDKNYILRKVQYRLADSLIATTLKLVKKYYQHHFNPLGLVDDFTTFLKDAPVTNEKFIRQQYSLLCCIYRRLHPDNQLEFLWDGSSQDDKYEKLWEEGYLNWQKEFCSSPEYVRMIIKGALMESNSTLLEKVLENMILKHFNFKKSRKGRIDRAA